VPIAASSSGGGSFLPLLFVVVIIVGMYFLMIRPQQRRNRQLQEMQATLGPGAEVMTGSGIYGTVTDVDEEAGTIDLEVSPGVAITFARGAVAKVISSGPEAEDETEDAVDHGTAADEVDHETDDVAGQIVERKD
jgi:preprotein translocase subunit YajC